MNLLQNHIEALIFCSQNPLGIHEIRGCVSEVFEEDVQEDEIMEAIHTLEKRYQTEGFSFQLYNSAGGYQFMTKPSYRKTVGTMLKNLSRKKLSTSALETLAIIAYKHPVSRTEVEHIRGVNCDYAIRKLLEKELITILGKAKTIGKPLLYGISAKFMEYVGVNSKNDLPTLKDFAPAENVMGEDLDY